MTTKSTKMKIRTSTMPKQHWEWVVNGEGRTGYLVGICILLAWRGICSFWHGSSSTGVSVYEYYLIRSNPC
jgi:hypothetical protein